MVEGRQSRESLPEIVVDHEPPPGDSPNTFDDAAKTTSVVVDQRETSTQKTDGDVWSPGNEYDYVLHRLRRRQQQQQPSNVSHALLLATAKNVMF